VILRCFRWIKNDLFTNRLQKSLFNPERIAICSPVLSSRRDNVKIAQCFNIGTLIRPRPSPEGTTGVTPTNCTRRQAPIQPSLRDSPHALFGFPTLKRWAIFAPSLRDGIAPPVPPSCRMGSIPKIGWLPQKCRSGARLSEYPVLQSHLRMVVWKRLALRRLFFEIRDRELGGL
jgi:hypothetical protein